ncbi:MAG: HEPN domain-containing protein [Armatimonadetes bacterium]|nr:HEPN domain-containing protein [Armatimonadota bacterium]
MTLEQAVRLWVEEGEHDLEVAAALAASGFHSNCAVSCEQSIEKLLKALWIYRNRKGPPRDHKIENLAAALGAPPNVMEASGLLEPDYILARYPDAAMVTPHTRYDASTSERRLEAAREVGEWVRQRLAEEGWA